MVLAELPFYDPDGDALTYRWTSMSVPYALDIDGRGWIVSNSNTRSLLRFDQWSAWGDLATEDILYVEICVEARDTHGATITRCIGMDFQDRNWPEPSRSRRAKSETATSGVAVSLAKQKRPQHRPDGLAPRIRLDVSQLAIPQDEGPHTRVGGVGNPRPRPQAHMRKAQTHTRIRTIWTWY